MEITYVNHKNTYPSKHLDYSYAIEYLLYDCHSSVFKGKHLLLEDLQILS